MGVSRLLALLLIELLGRIDVLVHERRETLLEFGTALARIEVHRFSLLTAMGLGSSTMSREGASYRAAGVDYDALDAGKRLAMAKALSTSSLLAAHGARALDSSRGEPAFVFELGGRSLAFVVEGLGTK